MTTKNTAKKKPAKKTKSPRELLKKLSDSPEVLEDFDEKLEKTKLVRTLIALRIKAKLTQSELAKRIGCTQSRISKLESSEDHNLSIQDLADYSCATRRRLGVEFGAPLNLVDQVKFHAFGMKAALDKVADIAQEDETDAQMIEEIEEFFLEATINIARMVGGAMAKVPGHRGKKRIPEFSILSSVRPTKPPEPCPA